MRGFAAGTLLLAGIVGATHPATAQHSYSTGTEYDPAVPTPRSVLGYDVGDRFTSHARLVRYVERLAAASPRLKVDTLGVTFEGRELLVIAVTSEANQRRLAEIQADAQRVAAAGSGADQAAGRLPAIVWLGFSVHGGEASGTEASLAVLYQLAAGRDADTRMVLDSTVVLIDPAENPDGHERHVQDVTRMRGAFGVPTDPFAMVHAGSWPGARTSHYYFDLNRDWFVLSHPETRARLATFLKWWPHVAVDLHEMGSNSTYFFAPPMEPVNKNVPAGILKWWDIYAAANASAFDRHGWSYFRREGYDEFYPGYGVSWPILTGAIGMTYEEASSAGGAIRREDGTVLTLHEAVHHHYTAAWATLLTSARRRAERVKDYLEFRRTAAADASRPPLRAVAIERDGSGRADSLVRTLIGNGIAVMRTAAAADFPGATIYGEATARPARLAAGTYVVDLAQPQGRLARALLEPDAILDSAFIRQEIESRRTGQSDRFYDVTAWSLPYAFHVRAWSLAVLPGGLVDGVPAPAPRPAPARAGYAYAFAPGSEESLRMLAGLLAEDAKVWFAPKAFKIGADAFPRGAFLVRVASNSAGIHDSVLRLAGASGARTVALSTAKVDEGTDLGSNSVFFIKPPRVGLLGGAPISGNSFGFAWFAFEQRLGFPVTPLDAAAAAGGGLDELDVLVVPSVTPGALERALGDGGRDRIASWVRNGGVLITLDGATAWLATERLGLSRLRSRIDSTRADSSGGAPLPADVPGAIVRVTVDSLSPLLAGIDPEDLAVLVNGARIYRVPRDLRPGEAVVRYAMASRLRLGGYLWPEIPGRLAESPYLWTERSGRGRVIGFAGEPNFRDLWRGLLPLFGNAVLLGASF